MPLPAAVARPATLWMSLLLAGPAVARDELPVPDATQVFAARCPAAMATYLRQALAGTEPVDEHVPAVCDCTAQRLASPSSPARPPTPAQATAELRACAHHSVVAHNRDWVERHYLPYLMTQRWDDGQISRFSLCLATDHWRQMGSAVLGERAATIDTAAAWRHCAAYVGRPDTPIRTPGGWPLDPPVPIVSLAAPK